jgi:hypothetical protein
MHLVSETLCFFSIPDIMDEVKKVVIVKNYRQNDDESLLGYSAVQSVWSRPTFQRCALLLLSGYNDGGSAHL